MGSFLTHDCNEHTNCPLGDMCDHSNCDWDHKKMIYKRCKLDNGCKGLECPNDNHTEIIKTITILR